MRRMRYPVIRTVLQGKAPARQGQTQEPSDAELNDKVSVSTHPVRNNGTSVLSTRINKGYFTRSE